VKYAWFAGILEGHSGDNDRLRQTVAELNALGSIDADLELDGGQFSVLFDDLTLAGGAFAADLLDRLPRLLQEIVDAARDPARVTSTVRCTVVHEDGVVETLFAPVSGVMRGVSRPRRVKPEDLERAPAAAAVGNVSGMGPVRSTLIGALMLVAFAMLAWQSGFVERLTSVESSTLTVDNGPFGELLTAEIQPNWGNYRVLLRRGQSYPKDVAQQRQLEEQAATLAERSAVLMLTQGRHLYLRLISDTGETLAYYPVDTRPLLTSDEAPAVGHLPGRSIARSIQLSISPGG